MSSGVLYRPLQPPTSVTAACCVQCSPSHVVVQLQDTQLTCWRAANGVLEQTASWRAPASMLQMVHLPNNYLLVMAEGGSIYMHRLQDQPAAATAPSLAAHDQLSVPIDTSCSQVAPFGCVVSSNVLTAATGNKTACLVATAYLPGVLHVIKATTAGSRGATSSEQLQTKAMLLTHVLLSCHYPGAHEATCVVHLLVALLEKELKATAQVTVLLWTNGSLAGRVPGCRGCSSRPGVRACSQQGAGPHLAQPQGAAAGPRGPRAAGGAA
jgi:hypothetical protein